MTPPSRLLALGSSKPPSRLLALAGDDDGFGPWLPTASPLVQRRRKPDGTWETRPTPREGQESAVTPAQEKGLGETLGDLADRAITSTAEGIVALPEVVLTYRKPGSDGKPASWAQPDIYGALTPDAIEGEGGFFDVKSGRQDIQRQYEEAKEEFRAANLPPVATATLDTAAEAVGPAEALALARLGAKGVARGIAGTLDSTKGIEGALSRELADAAPAPLPERRSNLALRKQVEEKMAGLRTATDDELRLLLENPPDEATERAVERLAFLRAKGTHAGPPGVAPQVPAPNLRRPGEGLQTLPVEALPEAHTIPRADFERLSPLPPETTGQLHRIGVEQAVAADAPVRPAVLKDYPDLSADIALPPPRQTPAGPAINPEAGFVKLPTGPGFLSRFFRKDGKFAALGAERGWAFQRANDMSAEIAAGERKISDTLRDFSSAFEDDVLRAGHQSPDDVLRYITEGLEGGNDLSGISPRLRSSVLAMRDHIDQLSDGYQHYQDLPASLRETIEQNKGAYLPRVFEAFENPDWPRIVDPTSSRHDAREAWRWDGYMTWARAQRDAAAQAPLYPGALVNVNEQTALSLATQHGGGFENSRVARVMDYDAQGQAATIRFEATGHGPVDVQVPRADLTNLADHIRGDWGDDQLTAYGQRLLDRDPDAFFGIGQSEIGRESRGNLKRRILQDPRVNDLPTDLAQKVNDGQLSLPTAIEQAKTRPGWFAQYLEHAPGLPEELDNLMGLYRDPSQRYRTGAARAVHDQAVYKMHADLAERGAGTLFFTEDTMVPGHYEKIGGKGPLSQLVTSPEIAAVIRGTENSSKQVSTWLAVWRKLNGAVKLAKTAGNFPAGHIRNAAAWPFQLMAGGHFVAAFNPLTPLKLLPYQVADKLGSQRGAVARMAKRLADSVELADGSRLGERWSMYLETLRPEIDYLYRLGVFGESSTAADLRHYAGAFPTLREPGPVAGARKALKAPVEAGINFWAGGDDLGKHVYFRAELHNLGWAENLGAVPDDYFLRPEWQDVAREAAQRTRLTTPTASMIAPGIKALRDAPLAPFPGWTAEVFRNGKEQPRLALADIHSPNPKRKILGAKRLSGFLATAALAGGGMAAILNRWSGAKDPEGVRSFVPPWSRDSQLAVLDVDRAGKVRYVDLSALAPQAAFMDSAATILRSALDPTDSSWDAALDSTQALVQPFVEEEIIANAALDWVRNKQGAGAADRAFNLLREHERYDPGYPVFTEGAKFTTQMKQSVYHWWRAVAPAGVAGLQGERLARAFWNDNPEVRKAFVEMTNYDRELKVEDEAMAGLGLRVTTTDLKKSLARLGTDYVQRRAAASSLYTRRTKMGPDGKAHPEVVLAAKSEANQMGRAAHEQTARIVADAVRLGYNQEQVRQWLKEGNIASKHVTSLIMDAQRLLRGEEPRFYIPAVP